ncbi:hypothetical protein HNQ88_001115 [Aureibacter tunicatorum]|uniref:Uncharacterized protein n=1 Tax=Aureibacter tunicatorum TaxID=866807 RepID=A0AAE3XLF6_9BACT|nr:hypothetical protein [Aureibacter tunicatorum]BDD03172.1 hypothetical protein AUTU_06550 [Aureibacter tunicatorum]
MIEISLKPKFYSDFLLNCLSQLIQFNDHDEKKAFTI